MPVKLGVRGGSRELGPRNRVGGVDEGIRRRRRWEGWDGTEWDSSKARA
jgi:hypothetical protein